MTRLASNIGTIEFHVDDTTPTKEPKLLFQSKKIALGGSSVHNASVNPLHAAKHHNSPTPLKTTTLGVQNHRGEDRTAQIINERVRMDSLSRFTSLCRHLNLEPLQSDTIHVIILLFSKQLCTISDENIKEVISDFATEASSHLNWDVYPSLVKNSNFNTIHDWVTLVNFLELNDNIDLVEFGNNSLIKRITAAFIHAGMDKALCTQHEFMVMVLLHITNHLTPQDKMLERVLIAKLKRDGSQPPSDLELRCLKILSHFNDSQNNSQEAMHDLIKIVSMVSKSSRFVEDIAAFFAKRESEKQTMIVGEERLKSRGRIRLRYFAQTVDNTSFSQPYERSFSSWANAQRFPISTSLRLQHILYFLRSHTEEIPMSVYKIYFAEPIAARVIQSKIDLIDADILGTIITNIRTYHFKIADMLDFRLQCLHGLSVTTRNSLTPAQVLQLYICCYQHYSVREILWRKVVNVWNHSIATALKTFTAGHVFDIENVLHAIMYDPTQKQVSSMVSSV